MPHNGALEEHLHGSLFLYSQTSRSQLLRESPPVYDFQKSVAKNVEGAEEGAQHRLRHLAKQQLRPFDSHIRSFRSERFSISPRHRMDNQNALNSSNGCPHPRHQFTDLHAVDPNSLRTSVCRDSQ